eukprot:COSAG06_NODE_33053_length_496_cov_0.654912_1_plen_37_part_10
MVYYRRLLPWPPLVVGRQAEVLATLWMRWSSCGPSSS